MAALRLRSLVAAALLLSAGPARGAVDLAKVHESCSASDMLQVASASADALAGRFAKVVEDLKLMAEYTVELNRKGGIPGSLRLADLCPMFTPNWEELGHYAAWSGYADCRADRKMELWAGNASVDDWHGVYGNNRSTDVDLAFVATAEVLFPWVMARQEGWYQAAYMGTAGEVWAYWPPFTEAWPGHTIGDAFPAGGEAEFRNDHFVLLSLEEHNPERVPKWTEPYLDPVGLGQMITAVVPIYFTGELEGHRFEDEYVTVCGIDITLAKMEHLLEDLRPSAGSLPFIMDDRGNLISAPPDVVAALFGEGKTISDLAHCEGHGESLSTSSAACGLSTSDRGNWDVLLAEIAGIDRGDRKIIDGVALRSAGSSVPLTAVAQRWSGDGVPPWTSVVLVPTEELNRQAQVLVPASVTAETDDSQGSVDVRFALENTGRLDLTFILTRQPAWSEILEPAPSAAGVDGPVQLPAGAKVEYLVRLTGSGQLQGAQTAPIAWRIEDDSYPDCFFSKVVAVDVAFTLPVGDEWALPTFAALGALLLVAGTVAAARFVVVRYRQLQKLKLAQAAHDRRQLQLAGSVVDTMAFPIYLLPTPTFAAAPCLVQHEHLRDQGKLKVFDLVEDLDPITYCFFSHQWTAWDEPDHTGVQFRAMVDALQYVAEKWTCPLDKSYVWVDYSSIPQKHQRTQQLAILSLPIYASRASSFVIVSPAVAHKNTQEPCTFETYMDRCWCRAEQYSHAVYRGSVDHMFCATHDGLEPVGEAQVNEGLRVFHGQLTCCRLKHRGMEKCDREHLLLPMLGVYSAMLRNSRRGGHGRRFLKDADLAELFPKHIQVDTERGTERRVLFGDLIPKLHAQLDGEEPEDQHCEGKGEPEGRVEEPLKAGAAHGLVAPQACPQVGQGEPPLQPPASPLVDLMAGSPVPGGPGAEGWELHV